MNVNEEIKKLEEQQELIQDKLDELYDIKNSENQVFRDNLVGKCFKDGSRYIKIFKKLDRYNFETFEFNTDFRSKEHLFDSLYNTFAYYDRFIQDTGYFDKEDEISNEEFFTELDRLVEKIKNNIKQ